MNWTELKSLQDLEFLWENSFKVHQYIFKHSPRCGISRMVLKSVEKSASHLDQEIFILDVVENRPISNEIEIRSGIKHESPQLIIIYKGLIVYSESHEKIQFKLYES